MFYLIIVMELIKKYTYNLEKGKKKTFKLMCIKKSLVKIIYNVPKGDKL